MKILAKADLDTARCAVPNCAHDHEVIFLHSACHRHRGVDVRYEKSLGHLIISCHQCGHEVARIAPSERGAPCQ
ncbi:MAG TPA: hypothetical protein VNW90_19300 [Acetobacteraceae bacterium]|jgi:hypothetical protein|nr:hypothetical protein [Acetobacteraceae bacterium]